MWINVLHCRVCEYIKQCFDLTSLWSEKVKSLSCVWFLATRRTVASQAPPSIGFSRQEYWSGLPFPSPGDLPNPGTEPMSFMSPALAGWRRQWHPTPVLLPGKSHGWRSLIGYSPWCCKESDTTGQLHFHYNQDNVILPKEYKNRLVEQNSSAVDSHSWLIFEEAFGVKIVFSTNGAGKTGYPPAKWELFNMLSRLVIAFLPRSKCESSESRHRPYSFHKN